MGASAREAASQRRDSAMNTFSFLKPGSRGHTLRKRWADDRPTEDNDGGSVPIATRALLIRKESQLRDGDSWLARGPLNWLSNEFSIASVKFAENRIEGLARQLWATQHGDHGDEVPPAAAFSDGTHDKFGESNSVHMPQSWPARVAIPVVLSDLANLPEKGQA